MLNVFCLCQPLGWYFFDMRMAAEGMLFQLNVKHR
ncbi:Uncharacterised protein [Escherichia coli]|nr:Uncharacterised protein [Escherichia coli]SQN85499.1 Uncharacterised protein [Escherichia coli]SQS60001.1 Uncharacterised protein [Escherichia coli]SQS67505.1 Uncharacterised protein [Escherichia coli]SQS86787.1 Uncharacterised protein [Escherichia coli]